MRPLLLAVPLLLAGGAVALAQSRQHHVNLDRQCEEVHGPSARALLLDPRDSYTWRCALADGQRVEISIDDACRRQYGDGWRARMLERRDPSSWRCVR